MMRTLIWAGLALPDAETMPETDFAVCVEGNQIVASGSRQALRARYPDAVEVGGDHLLLFPALTNSHDHGRGLGTASLGIQDDLLEIWLPGLWSQPILDPYLAAVYDGIRLLRAGVSTTAHSHNPRNWQNVPAEAEATLRGYRDAGIRVAFHPVIIDQNFLIYDDLAGFLAGLPAHLEQIAQSFLQVSVPAPKDYFAMCADLFQSYHDADQYTAHLQVSPSGGQWCSDELILAAVDFARQHQTRVQMHMLETRYQRHYAYRRWGKSFIQHLEEIGALGPWLTLAHMVWVDEADLPLLAERGVGIAHNPSSNLRLRSGIAPLAKMDLAGITTGIGLDGHGLDEDQDYLRELRLAWTLGNRPGAAEPSLPAQAIWRMGTSAGAAVTLGPAARLGKLAPGYLADLVLFDWQAAWGSWAPAGYPPVAELAALLLRLASHQHVQHVMVNGRWAIWAGQARQVDEATIAAAIRAELAAQNVAQPSPAGLAAQQLATYIRRFYAQWDR